MEKELDRKAFIVATGGLGEVIGKEVNIIDVFNRTLTLDGLKMLYDMNKE